MEFKSHNCNKLGKAHKATKAGLHCREDSMLASITAALGLNPGIPKFFSEEILKLLSLIMALLRLVDGCLIMLIEII